MEPLWTIRDVGNYVGLSESRVRDLVAEGKLKPFGRRGPRGAYLFRQEEVDRWLRSCFADPQVSRYEEPEPGSEWRPSQEDEHEEGIGWEKHRKVKVG